jgi:hypothetical protein
MKRGPPGGVPGVTYCLLLQAAVMRLSCTKRLQPALYIPVFALCSLFTSLRCVPAFRLRVCLPVCCCPTVCVLPALLPSACLPTCLLACLPSSCCPTACLPAQLLLPNRVSSACLPACLPAALACCGASPLSSCGRALMHRQVVRLSSRIPAFG